jgi:hypothetical protein
MQKLRIITKTRMEFGHMAIKLVSRVARFSTMFAGVVERARKVNVLHVFPEIPTPFFHHTAECTTVAMAAGYSFDE